MYKRLIQACTVMYYKNCQWKKQKWMNNIQFKQFLFWFEKTLKKDC